MPGGSDDGSDFGSYTVRARWQKSDLRYYVHSYADGIARDRQHEIFAQALTAWADVTPLTFTEVGTEAEADFLIGFGDGRHCELYAAAGLRCPPANDDLFYGPGNILAHAYYPGAGDLSGEAHFDAGEPWVDGRQGGFSLLSVAMHEFGHTLGLDHSADGEALMFASYETSNVKEALARDDIAGIQAIYGDGGGSTSPPPPPPPPDDTPTVESCGTPTATDADGDGVPDSVERYQLGTDPAQCDTDQDGLPDREAAYGLNPLNPDTDGDGVSDGDEVAQGSNPFVPDQGTGTSQIAGYYTGNDSFGSPLAVQINADGSATGVLRIMYFGQPTDIALSGGLDNTGALLLVSYDYFFAYRGNVGGGQISGQFQTRAGAVGTWTAYRQSASNADQTPVVAKRDDADLVDSARYQPTIGQRKPTTFRVHQRVGTTPAHGRSAHSHASHRPSSDSLAPAPLR